MQFERCAWCSDFLTGSEYAGSAICDACIRELGQVPDLTVNIGREFVDNLPYGNIVLNPEGKIIRYNATEAEHTGYDVSKIEGKHFFDEVAPCTKVENFHGKLEEFRRTGQNTQYLFKFNFRHPNFSALVSILMTYYRNGYTVLSIKKIRDIET
ncbi:MAG: PAS domain-containing protein [Candidatus Kariarchaeaceae archaeon]|jgi:photoactive yellow protein